MQTSWWSKEIIFEQYSDTPKYRLPHPTCNPRKKSSSSDLASLRAGTLSNFSPTKMMAGCGQGAGCYWDAGTRPARPRVHAAWTAGME